MRRLLVGLLVSAGLWSLAAAAGAALVDFESLYPGFETWATNSRDYAGLRWYSYGYETEFPDNHLLVWATSQYKPGSWTLPRPRFPGTRGRVTAYSAKQSAFSMSTLDGALFTLDSAVLGSSYNDTCTATIEGWRGDTQLYTTSLTVPYTGEDVAFGWSGINKVVFTPDPVGSDWVMVDDVRYTPVPEPASCALLACAIGGLAAMVRRRRWR